MSRGAEKRLEKYGRMVARDDRPIRVLYVVPGSPGSSSLSMVFVHEQITHLEKAGLETRTSIFSAGANLQRALREAWGLRQLVRDYRPDIVHAQYGTLTAFTCALISLVPRVPLVITYHGSDLNPSPSDGTLRSTVQKLLSQFAALRASAIICVSHQLRNRLWWCRGKVVVIPCGVDLDLFQPIPRAEARSRLGWRDGERIVLFNAAGRTTAGKRLDLAEAAVAVMRGLIGEVRFVVLRGGVPHEEMPLYLSGADCLLMTSDYEGSPTIIKEALACALPIVSVDVGDVVERLKGVHPSRIVPRDPRVIGSAAAEIVLSGRRSNGREVIRELSATAVRDKILQVYNCVLGGGRYGN